MREIKFRLWSIETKKMLEPETLEVMVENGGILALGKWFEIMQYTGLKDKKGKEIYIGDILKWNGARFWKERNVDVGVVEYTDDDLTNIGVRNDFDGHYYSLDLHPGRGQGYEVIGNIYENPEFLSTSSKNESE